MAIISFSKDIYLPINKLTNNFNCVLRHHFSPVSYVMLNLASFLFTQREAK
jgi:hypothetical protein